MERSTIFNHLRILLIDNDDISNDELTHIATTLKENGALDCSVYKVKADALNDNTELTKHDLEVQFPEQIHCIICRSIKFPFYRLAAFDLLIPVVNPTWVDHCLKFKRLMRTTCYSLDPSHFLKDCYIFVSKHSLSQVEYQFYCSIITSLGGTCMDYLSTKATHIITWDKNDIAIKAMQKFDKYKVIFLLPNWLIDCLSEMRYINENEYLINVSSDVDLLGQKINDLWEKSLGNIENWKVNSRFQLGKGFILSEDLALSGPCYKFLINWIKKCLGGRITLITESSQLRSTNASIFIGYRYDNELVEVAKSCGLACGNISWLFYIWQMERFVHPNTKLLLSPYKKLVFSKENLRVTFTNYYGEQRYYIQRLVEALGGSCSTELTKKNTHLISSISSGKKFEAASAWNSCITVNHLWLESCYREGKKLDSMLPKFQEFPPHGGLMQSLGQMPLEDNSNLMEEMISNEDKEHLADVYIPATSESNVTRVSNISRENNQSNETDKALESEAICKISTTDYASKTGALIKELEDAMDQDKEEKHSFEDRNSFATPLPSKEPSITPSIGNYEDEAQPPTPSTDHKRRAKTKAAEKLHTDMESLNEFQKISKRKRTPDILPEELVEIKKKKVLDAKADEIISALNLSQKPYRIRAVLTNCHENLSEMDLLLLSKIGVIITPNIEPNTNTIIAPKKARTAKFLKSFSFKPLKYALLPTFITHLLSRISKAQPLEFDMTKYFIPDISADVLQKTKLSSKLFKRFGFTHVNICDDIPGGYELVSSILKCHGMEEVNAIGKKFTSNDLVLNKNKKGSPEYVLIATKASIAKKFSKCVKDTYHDKQVFVVEWNWCVKNIFNLDIDLSDHEYVIYNK